MVSEKKKDFWISYDENPFDPFTQFDDWFRFDNAFGYKICDLISQEAPTSEENLTEFENNELINEAINLVLDRYEESYDRYNGNCKYDICHI